MTQGVYMVILDFIQSHQKEFAEFCGDESIAWGNYSEFKKWLEERDKSDAKILYELKAKNERLDKEADWLAKNCQGEDQCPYLANYRHLKGDLRPKWCDCLDNGEEFDCDEYEPDCWRKAAREAVNENEENKQ